MMRFICSSATLLKAPKELVIGKAYSVGRSSKCAFVLNEPSVSRAHAEIEVGRQQLLIKDLESLNGTYVDGTKIKHVELQPGQKVHFGIVPFRLMRGEEPIDPNDDALSAASTFVVPGKKRPVAPLRIKLSEGQMRVLEQLKKGFAEKQVAVRLQLSPHTVHNHTKAIYKKFKVSSRPELLALFMMEEEMP